MQLADVLNILQRKFPHIRFETIFDVGANFGQTCSVFLDLFPHAKIIAIEPSPDTFAKLTENISENGRISAFQIALSSTSKDLRLLTIDGPSTSDRLIGDNSSGVDYDPLFRPHAMVMTEMGDVFCNNNRIKKIQYLKIDTEGHDLEVLKGFFSMLRRHDVDFVDVEVGMHRKHGKFIHFAEICEFMEKLLYYPFYIYDQAFERNGRAHLRRANVIFVSDLAIQENRSP